MERMDKHHNCSLMRIPSLANRYQAEHAERARLLAEVTAHGLIDNYSGVRISRTGQRFLIEQATVWNLSDEEGRRCGQAATFRAWRLVENAERG